MLVPFKALLQSRKFLLLVFDVLISLVLYFVGKYAPGAMEDIKFLVLTLQPVIISVILSIAHEDAAIIKATGEVDAAKAYPLPVAPEN